MADIIDQRIWTAKAASQTVELDDGFAKCLTKAVDIVLTGFSGTLDFQGKDDPDGDYANLVAVRSGVGQTPSAAQLSFSNVTATYKYYITDFSMFTQIVMTRSAGTISCYVSGSESSIDMAGVKAVCDDVSSKVDLMYAAVGAPQTLDSASEVVAQGFYAATTLSAVDSDLAVANIKNGVTIFGKLGTYDKEDSNPVVAARMKTGDVAFVNGAKITGNGTVALNPALDVYPQGYHAGNTSLHAVESDLAAGNIKNGVVIFGVTGIYDYEATNPVVALRMKTGDIAFVNGAKITGTGTKTLNPAANTFAEGYYAGNVGGLSAIEVRLVTGNIKAGATIFGVDGKTEVVDTTEAGNPVVAARMKTGDIAFVNGNKITGVGTVALDPTKDEYPEGYHAGNTSLHAVEADLVTGNIKSGITIFGVEGKTEVVDTVDAVQPVIAARMRTGDIAFVNGSKITGTGTKTLAPAANTFAGGYYAGDAGGLSAVEERLISANIKSGLTIFGVSGSSTVKDVSDTTAVAADVAAGKFFYLADGTKVEGTVGA